MLFRSTSGTCGDNATWSFENGVLTISGTGAMTDFSSLTYQPWKSFGDDITSVVINEGITSIGQHAFNSRAQITSITLPTTLQSIGYRAFCNSKSIDELDLSDCTAFNTIGKEACTRCGSLKRIYFPATLTAIGESACTRCTPFKQIDQFHRIK